jgi:uncharacterized delta-60 repeat protein
MRSPTLEAAPPTAAFDVAGQTFLAGSFTGTADVGSDESGASGVLRSLTSQGKSDIYLLKNDSFGRTLWAHSLGSGGQDTVTRIAADGLGQVLVLGTFEQTVDFDPGVEQVLRTASDSRDTFLAKYRPDGQLAWVHTWDLDEIDAGMGDLVAAPEGTATVGWSFAGTVDADPGAGERNLVSAGLSDIGLVQLDADGQLVWAQSVGGTGLEEVRALARDGAGNLLVGGRFAATVDFDPGPGEENWTSDGATDGFVWKLGVGGQHVWTRTLTSSGGEMLEGVWDLDADAEESVYVAGAFAGSAMPDPNLDQLPWQSLGLTDGFAWKLSGKGDTVWATRLSGGAAGQAARGTAIRRSLDGELVYVAPSVGPAAVTMLEGHGVELPSSLLAGARAHELLVDSLGNLLAVGTFRGTLAVDPAEQAPALESFFPAAYFARYAPKPADPGSLGLQTPAFPFQLAEDGNGESYTVTLSSQPLASVEIVLEASPSLEVNPSRLVFTAETWNVPQQVLLRAPRDHQATGTVPASVLHVGRSADPRFQDLQASLGVDILDADVAPPLDSGFGVGGILMTGIPAAGGGMREAMAAGAVGTPSGELVIVGTGYDDGLLSPSVAAVARYNAAGQLVPGFGAEGLVLESWDAPSVLGQGVALQSSDRLLAVVSRGDGGGVAVVRYLPDGQRDLAFGASDGASDGRVFVAAPENTRMSAVAIQTHDNDAITVATHVLQTATGQYDLGLLRLTANGTPDASFGTNGRVVLDLGGTLDLPHAMHVLPDHRVLVAGESQGHSVVVRFLPNGQLDATFGTSGILRFDFGGPTDRLLALTVDPQQRVVVAGLTLVDLYPRLTVARLTANGVLDGGFGSNGRVVVAPPTRDGAVEGVLEEQEAAGVAVLRDGTVLVASTLRGPELEQGQSSDWVLSAFHTDGALAEDFGQQGHLVLDFGGHEQAAALLSQGDGQVVIVGTHEHQYAAARLVLETFDPYDLNRDGLVDTRDIDYLYAALRSQNTEPRLDLNLDGKVDRADVDYLVRSVLKTEYGDVNLNGIFNSSDLVLVFQAGEYEDGVPRNSVWLTGDWNGDAEFSSSDFVFVFQQGGYVSNAKPPHAGPPASGPSRWELAMAAFLREEDARRRDGAGTAATDAALG